MNITAHPARAALEKWSARHSGIWRIVDHIRNKARHEIPGYHPKPYIFLSLREALASTRAWRETSGMPRISREELLMEASELKQFASWRPTQGIYRFDPTIYEALRTTPVDGEIPAELFRRLPEWCVYLEIPPDGLQVPLVSGRSVPLLGVWATLEHADGMDIDVLHMGMHSEEIIGINHLPLSGTLENSLRLLEEDWRAKATDKEAQFGPHARFLDSARKIYPSILSMLLYLCADEPEIGDGSRFPSRAAESRTKRGMRTFPADKPTVWGVGVRMGAALRRAYESTSNSDPGEPTGRRVRPHVRHAHWHTYRIGHKRTESKLKWLPAIPVNLKDIDALPATIRPVQS